MYMDYTNYVILEFQLKILEELVFFISFEASSLGKGIHPNIIPTVMGK